MRQVKASSMLRVLAGQVVEKGNVRNTVLRQINSLQRSHKLLDQGKGIKEEEISAFEGKNPGKADILKKQVEVISSGIAHIEQAIEELKKYKDLTTSHV